MSTGDCQACLCCRPNFNHHAKRNSTHMNDVTPDPQHLPVVATIEIRHFLGMPCCFSNDGRSRIGRAWRDFLVVFLAIAHFLGLSKTNYCIYIIPPSLVHARFTPSSIHRFYDKLSLQLLFATSEMDTCNIIIMRMATRCDRGRDTQ